MSARSGRVPIGRPERLYQSVIDYVTALISTDQLTPGSLLPTERELVVELGVSRNVLREGFRVLEERGLIVTRQGAGRYVRELPSEGTPRSASELVQLEKASISDVLEARLILEQETTSLACERRTTREAQELSALAERHITWEENTLFHAAIARMTHNFMLERIVVEQMRLLGDLRQRTHYPSRTAARLIAQHRDIAAAVIDRDIGRGRFLMREHLLSTKVKVGAR